MAEVLAKAVAEKLVAITIGIPAEYAVEMIKSATSLKGDMKQMQGTIEAICVVLKDAEDQAHSNERIKIWVRDLKSVFYDIDDILDEVAYYAKLRKANEGHYTSKIRYYASSSSNPIISRFRWGQQIRFHREKLEGIVAKKVKFGLSERPIMGQSSRHEVRDPLDGCAFVHHPSIIGREHAKLDILDKISGARKKFWRRNNGRAQSQQLFVLPVVGMGGIGKTALAKVVYADVKHFDLKLWVCVSDKFEIPKIIKDIVKGGGGGDVMPNQDLNTLVKRLNALLQDKKYFLVLDDVWVENVATWKKLKDLLPVRGRAARSVILITTRNPNVASICQSNMKPYDLEKLPEGDCWSIFERLAFSQGEEETNPRLFQIGKAIVKKCYGIPLVVITLGSLLRNERDDREWQRIDDMDSFAELNQHYGTVIKLLKLSYDKLPSHLKPCFAHMSLFPKGVKLLNVMATNYWSALGLLQRREENRRIEDIGYSYFMELARRSLLQDLDIILDNIQCKSKMHDLLHDLAKIILGEEISVITPSNMDVSEFTRHIIWRSDQTGWLKDMEFPKELLKARNVRTFQFSYAAGHISRSFLEGIISHCSCLRIFDLSNSWFEELPVSIGNLIHLRYLNLSNNPFIRTLPKTICKLLNLEVLLFLNCVALKEIPNKGVIQLQNLRQLSVTTCHMLLVDNQLNKLSCLNYLAFESCDMLESLWDNNGNIGGLTSLQHIYIKNCPKLRYLPKSMKFLSSLKVLGIWNCEELDMGEGEWLQGLQSLQYLTIIGLPKIKSIPSGIQSSACSLTKLVLKNCRGLVELPLCLQKFTSLKLLIVQGCPHLTESCVKPIGKHYPLIKHIPSIYLDGVLFTSNQNSN